MIFEFLSAFVLTQTSEIIAILLLARYVFGIPKKKIPNSKLIMTCFIASTITLPALWFILPLLIHNYYWLLMIGESLVIIIEAIIYYLWLKQKFATSLTFSLVCNLFSIMIGILLIE